MAKDKKKKTPSRIKYEQSHRTVSFRPSNELYDRLQAVKEEEGLSNTDVLKVGVGLLEVKVRSEREASEQSFEEGFEKGFEEAESIYKVTFPCSVCRKTIEVSSDKTKEAIRKYMLERGWGHADCINRRYKR